MEWVDKRCRERRREKERERGEEKKKGGWSDGS